MAYITIYRFRRNGYAAEHAWIANPWQGAIAIWQALEQRYLTPYIPEYIQRKWWYRPGMSREDLQKYLGSIPSRTGGISSVNAIQEIWDLVDNPAVAFNDRIVLATTLDNILIKKEDISRVAEAFDAFSADTSLPKQAEILRKLASMEDCIAAGWCQTTVVTENWGNRGIPDPETGASRSYNCLTQSEHEWLFETLR